MPAAGPCSTLRRRPDPVQKDSALRIPRTVSILLLLAWTTVPRAYGQAAPPAVPAVDPISGVVHSRRLASGVPFGGIGTGTFQVMTDGRISAATYNNNWAYPTGDLPGCFAAVHVKTATQKVSRVLALKSAYELPSIAGLNYEGLFPVAKMTFQDQMLPISISARVFSPLIPHDVRNSSFPAAAFLFRITNTSGVEIEASVALAWENTLGVGGTVATGSFDNRTGNTVNSVSDTDGFFAQKFERQPEKETDDAVKLRNNSAGDMTLMAAPGQPQAIVTTAAWNALDKRPAWWTDFESTGTVKSIADTGAAGEVHPAGVVCVRLTLRPRQTVDLPFAISWYTPRLNTTEGGDYGHYYQTIWPNSYTAARGLLTEWHSLLALTEEWQQRILFSNLPRWMCRRLINSVSPITTHSIWTRDKTFAMLDDVGSNRFGRTAREEGSEGDAKPGREPPDFGTGPRAHRPGSRLASLSHQLAASSLIGDLYPMLAARELRLFIARQAADGSFPATLGDIDRLIGVPQADSIAAIDEALVLSGRARSSVLTPEGLEDSSAFLLQMAQYVFRTGDREFLQAYFVNIRRALGLCFENLDADGLPAIGSGRSLSPANASLFLAALQAGARLSRLSAAQAFVGGRYRSGLQGAFDMLERAKRQSDENALAVRCDTVRTRAAAAMDTKYWNGRYYADRSETGAQFSSLSQLIGLGYSDILGGEGPAEAVQQSLLPEAKVQTALISLQRLNDNRSSGYIAPIARSADDGAPTLPNDQRISDLRDAVMGDAVVSITRRQPDYAVGLLRRLDDTSSNILLSPWQSPGEFSTLTGKTARFEGAQLGHAADWNLLAPLEGFAIDLNSGQFSLSPQIPGNWRSIAGPIFAPTFWGRMEFRPTARGGTVTLRIDRLIALPAATAGGRLSGSAGLLITRLRIPGPPPRPAGAPAIELPVAHVSRGTTPLGVKSIRDRSGDFILTFETPVKLTTGDRLEIDLH